MRRALALAILLAGCAGPPAPTGPESPLASPVPPPPPPFVLADSDLMLQGIDRTWSFDVLANASMVSIAVATLPVQGHRGGTELTARALHNGTVAAEAISGIHGSFGAAGPKSLIDILARDTANATALVGSWQVVLQGGPQLAQYDVRVRIDYCGPFHC